MAKKKSRIKGISDTFVWVILLFVFVGLGGYGVVNFSRGVTHIGQVGDTPISVTRYFAELNRALTDPQSGQAIPVSMARQFGVDREVLGNLVNEVSAEHAASELGLSVGDVNVAEAIKADASFAGLSQSFDRAVYVDRIKRWGYTEAEYEAEVRAELARQLLERAVMAGSVLPEDYSQEIYNFIGERRAFTWAKVTAEQLDAPVAAPTDDQIKAWYDANPADFTLPETKRIEYVVLKPEDVAGSIPPDEDKLRAFYESRIDEYVVPERRLVERLIFSSSEAADAAMAELTSGAKTFDDLVEARNLTLDDVDLGEQTLESLGPAGEAIFALTEPGVAGPVDNDLGAAIYRMNAILAPSEITFDEVKADLQQEYAIDQARVQIRGQMEAVDDELAAGATLAEVAESENLEHGQIDFVPGMGEGMAAYKAFADAAAEVTADSYPTVQALDDGGLFALSLVEIIPPTLQPLEDVRAQVIDAWTADATLKAVTALAEAKISALKAGETAEVLGLTLIAEDPVQRDHFFEDLPEGAVAEVFKLGADEMTHVESVSGAPVSVILQVTEILPPDPDDAELLARKVAFEENARQGLELDLLQSWNAALQRQATVQVDQTTIDAVLNQYN